MYSIKELIKESPLTVREIGKKVGCSGSNICKITRHGTVPSVIIAKRLCKVLSESFYEPKALNVYNIKEWEELRGKMVDSEE